MTRNERDNMTQKAEKRYLLQRFTGGCRAIQRQPLKLLWVAAYILLAVVIFLNRERILKLDSVREIFPPIEKLIWPVYLFYFIAGFATLIVFLGSPRGWKRTKEDLRRAGITNHAKESPMLLRTYRKGGGTVWEFDAGGIPKSKWEESRAEVETALNVNLVKIEQGEDKQKILLHTIPGNKRLPDFLPWDDSYLIRKDFVLTLGEGLFGPVTADLEKIPHILLGGSTGSGKSVLLKLMLMQSWQKGAEIVIADFKGGVDFSRTWHEKCRMCFAPEDLLNVLTDLVNELEARKELFRESGCSNLTEYNRHAKEKLPRMIFACDEVAEVLDKTGLGKEQKELISQIENRLSVIARQGRAFGIHLILATQRPDATIIPGQIRSNLDVRICGKADNILSQIILDNASAGELIPKYSQGRFLTGDGTLFQAYWFDDSK